MLPCTVDHCFGISSHSLHSAIQYWTSSTRGAKLAILGVCYSLLLCYARDCCVPLFLLWPSPVVTVAFHSCDPNLPPS